MNAELLLQHFKRLSEAPDAIQHLRRFILDLAVRGKLVEQDPNDEPTSELLKRIQAEKARLVKDGALKKSVLMPSSDNIEVPLDLPATWALVCLGDVAHYGISEKVDSNREIEPETWVLDLEDIEKDTSRLINCVVSSARPFRSTKTVFKRGDVLFGKLRPYLNKVVVADMDGVCSTEIVPIRGYCGIVPEYTKLVLKSPLTMRHVDRLMYGMKMPRLGTNDAISLEFPLPPLTEQHRIVAKVVELMALCDQLEAAKAEREQSRDRLVTASLQRLNQPADNKEAFREHARFTFNHLPRLTIRSAHIKQMRQTILNLAVRGKLVPQNPNDEPANVLLEKIAEGKINQQKLLHEINEDEKMFDTPSGWTWTRSETVASFIDPQPSHRTPPEYKGGIPYVGYTDIDHVKGINFTNARKIAPKVFEEHLERYQLKIGDFVFGKIGTLGKPFFLSEPFDYCLSANLILIQPNSMVINPKFLAMFLDSPIFINVLVDQKTNSTHGVFGIKKARLISLPLPPLAEQHRIVTKVDELMALCDQLEAQLTTTEADSRRLLEAVLHEALAPALEEAA